MSTPSEERRLRVQGPRSAAGCRICKQRHVKCDETRPECKRCLKGGRRCEYARPPGTTRKSFIIYTVSRSPPTFPDLDACTQRALHHYRVEAAPAITYPFYSELWSKTVFQMSEKYPFVMSALIALSNMYELYQQPSSARLSLQQSSIHHYNKAINGIVSTSRDEDSMEAIIVSSIIFYALDNIRGSWSSALRHAISGMNMIEEHQKLLQSQQNHKKASETMIKKFRDELVMLTYQALEMGGLEHSKLHLTSGIWDLDIPASFASAEQAFYHYQVLHNRSMNTIIRFKSQSPTGNSGIQDVIRSVEGQHEVDRLKAGVQSWDRAFQPLQQQMIAHEIKDERQRRAISYMKMMWDVMLAAYLPGRTLLNTESTKALEEMWAYHNLESDYVNNKFALYLSHLPVLFQFATRGCPEEQELALRTLRSGILARREGAWTTVEAAVIAERVINMKENMPDRVVDVLEIDLFDGCRVKYLVRNVGGYGNEHNPPPEVYEEIIQLDSYMSALSLEPSPLDD
ncbi:unnamed protein product [Periconia digitata]|uniref:Zn(2)-C6 fungal-type domain-containing protein n=1 Tax=Periconia digitata TaxID=1303443 RepID=A0A9W4U742_9PLEO|nr:unnamed protein product [Periconia digitata]